MPHTTQQRIRMKAYEIWLREGCPEGSDLRHWEMAKKFIVGDEAKSALTARFYDVHEINEAERAEATAVSLAKKKAGKH